MYNNNFKNNAIMRKIYKLLMSLVAMLAMAPVGLQAQSGNWTDGGNRAAEFSNVSGSTITITSAAEFALLAYNVNNGTHYQVLLSCWAPTSTWSPTTGLPSAPPTTLSGATSTVPTTPSTASLSIRPTTTPAFSAV